MKTGNTTLPFYFSLSLMAKYKESLKPAHRVHFVNASLCETHTFS